MGLGFLNPNVPAKTDNMSQLLDAAPSVSVSGSNNSRLLS